MLQESCVQSEVPIRLKDIAMHISLSRNQDSVWRLYQPLIFPPVSVSPPFPDLQLFESTLWSSGKVKEAE